MPADPPLYVEDIVAGVWAGRLGERSAAAMIEQRLAAQRQVMAHAGPAMRNRVLKAVNDALSGDGQDEYSSLFDPAHPLGPELGQEEYTSTLVYPGEDQGKPRRVPRTSYAAAPLSNDKLYDALFGPLGQGGEGTG